MIGAGLLTAWQFVKNLPWQLWLVLAVIATGCFYGNARYNDGREDEAARRDKIVAAAVLKAIEAERAAAAKHEARETQRQAATNELREAAAKAPVGAKTAAVLDTLRQSRNK